MGRTYPIHPFMRPPCIVRGSSPATAPADGDVYTETGLQSDRHLGLINGEVKFTILAWSLIAWLKAMGQTQIEPSFLFSELASLLNTAFI